MTEPETLGMDLAALHAANKGFAILVEKQQAEIERLRAALEPVRTIYAPPPQTGSQSDTFERGCPLSPPQIRKMQEAIGIVYEQKPEKPKPRKLDGEMFYIDD